SPVPRWRAVAKYGAIGAAAARRTLGERAVLGSRALFLVIILLILFRLWAAVLARGDVAGAGPRELVWYLAITEWCMLSVAPIFLTIEADIRSGDVACHLVRPVSYT